MLYIQGTFFISCFYIGLLTLVLCVLSNTYVDNFINSVVNICLFPWLKGDKYENEIKFKNETLWYKQLTMLAMCLAMHVIPAVLLPYNIENILFILVTVSFIVSGVVTFILKLVYFAGYHTNQGSRLLNVSLEKLLISSYVITCFCAIAIVVIILTQASMLHSSDPITSTYLIASSVFVFFILVIQFIGGTSSDEGNSNRNYNDDNNKLHPPLPKTTMSKIIKNYADEALSHVIVTHTDLSAMKQKNMDPDKSLDDYIKNGIPENHKSSLNLTHKNYVTRTIVGDSLNPNSSLVILPKEGACHLDYLSSKISGLQNKTAEHINNTTHEHIYLASKTSRSFKKVSEGGSNIKSFANGYDEDDTEKDVFLKLKLEKGLIVPNSSVGDNKYETVYANPFLQTVETSLNYDLETIPVGLFTGDVWGLFTGFGYHVGFSGSFVSSFTLLLWPFLIVQFKNTTIGTAFWAISSLLPLFISFYGKRGQFWEIIQLTFLVSFTIFYASKNIFYEIGYPGEIDDIYYEMNDDLSKISPKFLIKWDCVGNSCFDDSKTYQIIIHFVFSVTLISFVFEFAAIVFNKILKKNTE